MNDDQNAPHLQTLSALEHEVRRQHGRNAPALLSGLPLDYERRVAALRRLAGLDPTDTAA